jgi:hypothetical protein
VIASIPLVISTNDTARLVIDGSGNFDFKSGTVTTSNASASEVGYKGSPQVSFSGTSSTDLTHCGKNLHYTGSGGDTISIPANVTVAYPIGTGIVFTSGGNSFSVAVTTDTLRLAGTGTTGTRTVAAYGVATVIKVATTTWLISGAGVT